MDVSKLIANPHAEASGVWIRFDADTEFLVGSFNSKNVRAK